MAETILRRGDSGDDVITAQNLLNRNGAILDSDGVFGKGTEDAVREFQSGTVPPLPITGVIDDPTWRGLRALLEPSPDIPARAVAFIGREEVGSRALYDSTVCRPTWPGGESGVTIGIGYDLGQESSFEADWKDVLTPSQTAALRPWLRVQGDNAAAGPSALTDVTIPWHAAWSAFIRRSLPAQVSTTRTAFRGPHPMPPLCFGVLVSLVFNRGASMTDSTHKPGDRTEMRAIRDAVVAGSFADIPAQLRSMERLWPVGNGVRARREREAKLFEAGLARA
jgi:GH24 family phage-related lysozyme (muramidase)